MSAERTNLSEKLLSTVKDRAQAAWDDLEELAKVEVQEALEDLANLTLYQLKTLDPGEKLATEMELRHTKARIASWTFVGASHVREAVKAALVEVAELLGGFLRGIVK